MRQRGIRGWRLLLPAAVAAVTLVLPGVASAASGGWKLEPVPLPGDAKAGTLTAVSCVSASDCVAVGAPVAPRPMAEQWNGHAWSVRNVPLPRSMVYGGSLSAVSCTAADACTAVGFHITVTSGSPGGEHPLAAHWNGHAWTAQAVPGLPGTTSGDVAVLTGISCTAAASCVAVGYDAATGGSQEKSRLMAATWNGQKWTVSQVATPAGTSSPVFTGVSCPAAADCTAVGYLARTAAQEGTLAEHWNGTSWTLEPTPYRAYPAPMYEFSAVSCVSASNCVATGELAASTVETTTLAESWNGQKWTVLTTPKVSGDTAGLFGVSCPAAADCVAAGHDANGPLTEQWNGKTWTVLALPSGSYLKDDTLNGVSCRAGGFCAAAGRQLRDNQGHTTLLPIAETRAG